MFIVDSINSTDPDILRILQPCARKISKKEKRKETENRNGKWKGKGKGKRKKKEIQQPTSN
jgi:hypothetical protein